MRYRGSLLCVTLLCWGFKLSKIDKRVFLRHRIVIVVVVVDDMKFVSNSPSLMNHLKKKLSSTFDVKLFRQLKSFIGWEIRQSDDRIEVSQEHYARKILLRCGMSFCNSVWTPLPTEADVLPAREDEPLLSPALHSTDPR